MYIRNYKGKMVLFDWKDYTSEKEMYKALWKICYNITITDDHSHNKGLIDFIKG